ncbi:hypothetical protein [Pseudorhodoferax sp.]|uniref:hypothetical protein n=1 Tax=Pseudorhodoferax sp. TaxID=1993553 RepID=UPI002DD63756|nr:hypothetical protein [Pseudorhodoferax sp.]
MRLLLASRPTAESAADHSTEDRDERAAESDAMTWLVVCGLAMLIGAVAIAIALL